MEPSKQLVIRLVGEINATEEKLARLNKDLDRALGITPVGPRSKRARSTPHDSMTGKIMDALLASGGPVSVQELVATKDVGKDVRAVASTLSRLTKRGKVQKVSRGVYQALQ